MKKLLTILLAAMMVLTLAGCTKTDDGEDQTPAYDYSAKSEGVMTYEEYAAAADDGSVNVVVEAYVQAAQSYWNGATLYLQDPDGAYFVYGGQISEEDYAKLVDSTSYGDGWTGLANGTKVKVEGTKSAWAGEVEITDATVTIIDEEHKWLADAEDVTSLLADETALAEHMNKKVSFTGMTVEAKQDSEGNDVAYLYNWDGSGTPGSDLYFDVSVDGTVYSFVVESYLCYDGSDVYEAVEALNIGDTVDLEGFLYWYNGANPHITSVTVK